jgi:Subtilase family
MSSMGSMDVSSGRNDDYGEPDNTRQLVNLINRNLDILRQGKLPIVAATPHWLSSGAGCVTHTLGVPPIPVSQGNSCTSSTGFWPITLPDLSDAMQRLTGDGVTVFVLDSMPQSDEINNAATSAGNNNLLLQKIVKQISGGQTPSIKLIYKQLSQRLDGSTPEQPKSGDDLYGRSFSFPSSDHGLFITGIVRDLAPGATIEYIRVLNDFGVGDNASLLDALSDIQRRMGENGDLHKQPVVINLSLGAIPSQEELARLWFNADYSYQAEAFVHTLEDIEQLQLGLHLVIQSLTELGAVIVASAGNDSSIHQWEPWTANPAHRKGPRYPAGFPEVISVGAVDKLGRAAPYSNYPQVPPHHNGIATYGGGIPTPVPSVGLNGTAPSNDYGPDPHTMTTATDVDGVIGVYTAQTYPALSADDPQPQSYNALPESYDWAYWSGTSFAAPIISAVAARILQLKSSSWQPYQRAAEVQRAITTPTGQSELLTGSSPLPLQTDFGFGVRILRAYQCVETQQDSMASVTVGADQEV